MKIEIPRIKRSYLAVILSVIAVIAVYFVVTSFTGRAVEVGKYDNFAKCLASKGIAMYGAEWCPHCQDQKKLFGSSVQFVSYVECPQNAQLCSSKGVKAYPTWEIVGRMYEGVQSLEQLGSLSGCLLS